MSLGAILDVAIGLVLVYLLLGMIGSALQESVATLLNKRGTDLESGIRALLAGTATGGPATALFAGVWNHALVQPGAGKRGPSYVAARNFSAALFDVLTAGSSAPAFTAIEHTIAALPAGPARESLGALVAQ